MTLLVWLSVIGIMIPNARYIKLWIPANANGDRILDVDANGNTYFDNPYLSETFDATDIYTSQPNQTITASVRGGGDKTTYYFSFQDLEQTGILENVPTYDRTSFRVISKLKF